MSDNWWYNQGKKNICVSPASFVKLCSDKKISRYTLVRSDRWSSFDFFRMSMLVDDIALVNEGFLNDAKQPTPEEVSAKTAAAKAAVAAALTKAKTVVAAADAVNFASSPFDGMTANGRAALTVFDKSQREWVVTQLASGEEKHKQFRVEFPRVGAWDYFANLVRSGV